MKSLLLAAAAAVITVGAVSASCTFAPSSRVKQYTGISKVNQQTTEGQGGTEGKGSTCVSAVTPPCPPLSSSGFGPQQPPRYADLDHYQVSPAMAPGRGAQKRAELRGAPPPAPASRLFPAQPSSLSPLSFRPFTVSPSSLTLPCDSNTTLTCLLSCIFFPIYLRPKRSDFFDSEKAESFWVLLECCLRLITCGLLPNLVILENVSTNAHKVPDTTWY